MFAKCPSCKHWVVVGDAARIAQHDQPGIMRHCPGAGVSVLTGQVMRQADDDGQPPYRTSGWQPTTTEATR